MIYFLPKDSSVEDHKASCLYIRKNKTPVEAYLAIDEIIKLAKKKNVDAIHPGYGFLSENAEFAKKCEENDIVFIGPTSKIISSVGDKISSKIVAQAAKVPTIPGVEQAIKTDEILFEKEISEMMRNKIREEIIMEMGEKNENNGN